MDLKKYTVTLRTRSEGDFTFTYSALSEMEALQHILQPDADFVIITGHPSDKPGRHLAIRRDEIIMALVKDALEDVEVDP